jgi:hypothetical protein
MAADNGSDDSSNGGVGAGLGGLDFGTGLSALDPTGSGGAQVGAYGGGLDLGLGVGPTGRGDINMGLDLGPSAGGLSMLGNNLPSFGQPSSWGRAAGIPLGWGASMFGGPLLGLAVKEAATYGPGAINSAFGLSRSGSPADFALGPGARGGGLFGGGPGGIFGGAGMGNVADAGGMGVDDPRTQMQLLMLLQRLQQMQGMGGLGGMGGGAFQPTGWPFGAPPVQTLPVQQPYSPFAGQPMQPPAMPQPYSPFAGQY